MTEKGRWALIAGSGVNLFQLKVLFVQSMILFKDRIIVLEVQLFLLARQAVKVYRFQAS